MVNELLQYFVSCFSENNSSSKKFSDHWPATNAASGGVMDMQHWPELIDSPAYFALKFDQNTCPELLDRLDERLAYH